MRPSAPITVIAALAAFRTAQADASQAPAGFITTYWDCCKPSAAWPGAAFVSAPAWSCAKDGVTRLADFNAQSACGGGPAYSCAFYQPFSQNGVGYAFSARTCNGHVDPRTYLCACYQIKIKERPEATLITQVINEGCGLADSQFDIQVPGGGVGDFNACTPQYNSPPDGWGIRYGGLQVVSSCSQLPPELQPGCEWRFSFFPPSGAITISSYERVQCPSALTSISNCVRDDEFNIV
ncbi:hypothetical protein OC835_004463 [Tilletia horrida]|nr:hypothetical protein OC835_004463 [Tilletia horrida]KAK0557765.1 hypothetical protein OC844_005509 [Tilletia horrida]